MTTEALERVEHQPLAIPTDLSASAIEMAVGMGDFSRFSPADTVRYLHNVCLSLQLNPLTLPIRIIEMDKRKVMYATAECAAQLRARDKVSIKTIEEKVDHGCYMVRVKASLPDGREQENIGVLSIMEPEEIRRWSNGQSSWVKNPRAGQTLQGQEYANAVMKCHTKASRRATLALCGLGIPDESEVEDMKRADAPGQVIAHTETASDRASKLNEIIAEAEVVHPEPEKPKPEPAPVNGAAVETKAPEATTTLPKSGELFSSALSSDAKPNLPTGQTPAPSTPSSKVTSTAPGALPDEQVFKLENVITAKGPQWRDDCLAYFIARKSLKPGQDLGHLSPQAANFILTHPDTFHSRVQQWIDKGRQVQS